MLLYERTLADEFGETIVHRAGKVSRRDFGPVCESRLLRQAAGRPAAPKTKKAGPNDRPEKN
jgi:hypothetical protein